jgi:hypothetical protein
MKKIITLVFILSGMCFGSVKIEEKIGEYGKEITLSNQFLSLTIYPEIGARIGKLVDLKSGINMVFFDYPPDHPKWKGGLGGALDDRKGLFRKYAYEVLKRTEKEISVYLKGPLEEDKILIEKIITLKDNSPSISVEYHYSNYSQKETGSYELGIRNFFWPGGGPPDWNNEKLFIPTIKTVREIGDNSDLPEELKGKFQLEIIPTWNAFIDKKNKRGLVFSFQDNFYRWFYRWIKGETATYEWVFSPLPPGKKVVTKFSISVVNGIDGCIDAGEKYVLNLAFNKEKDGYKVAHYFYPLDDLKDVKIVSSIYNRKTRKISNLPLLNFGSLKVGDVYNKEVFWNISDGLIIQQKIYSGKEIIGDYEIPIPLNNPPIDYVREKKGRKNFVMKDIPGFQLEKKEKVKITEQDRERGYLLYRDYFAFEEEIGKHTENIDLYIGKGELESVAFKIRVLKDKGDFEIFSDDKRLNIYIQEDVDLKLEKSGLEGKIGYKLVRGNRVSVEVGKDKTIWLILDGRGLEAGSYEIPVTIKSKEYPAGKINLRVRVFDVRIPDRNIFDFEAEGYLLSSFAGMCKWDMNLWKRYVEDLSIHRVSIAQIFDGFEKKYDRLPDELKIKTIPDGEIVRERKSIYGKFLDFTSWNKWIDEIIGSGLVRVYIRENGLQERTEDEKWAVKELARYLGEKGYTYRDRIVKFVDEMPAEFFPKMNEIGMMYNKLGWRVLHTCFPVKSSIQMSILNPSTDFWHGPIPDEKDREARLKEGNLDPQDEIWTYSGWGAVWASYESRRNFAWRCASNNLNGMHLHVYYRGSMADALIFPEENGPVPSAAWEGARDGIEDVQYLEMAKQWIRNLKENGIQDEKLLEYEKKLANISVNFKDAKEILYEELIKAKLEILNILSELKKYKHLMKTSIFYGFDCLALKNEPRFVLSGDKEIAGIFNEKIKSHSSISFNYNFWNIVDKSKNNFIIFLTKQDNLSEFKNKILNYPPEGSYSIYKLENIYGEGKQIIIILGGDKEGLKKGMNNFYRFLRFEPEGY